MLQGGGVIAAGYATGALANTDSTESWHVEREGDPRVAERQVYFLSYRKAGSDRKDGWVLPEIAFGEIARIHVSPRPLDRGEAPPTDFDRIAQRVVVDGINLTGDNGATFNLIVDLRYKGTDGQTPVIDFLIEDWVFKSIRQVASRQDDEARVSSPVQTAIGEKTVADFVAAIFGPRARLAGQGDPQLTLEFPKEKAPADQSHVIWRIASRTGKKAVLEIPPFAEGSKEPLATSISVEVTRVADEPRPNTATTESAAAVRPLVDLSRPKTVARFFKASFGNVLALGAHPTPEETRIRVNLHSPSYSDKQQHPTLTRSAGGEVVFRASGVSGDLYVVGEGAAASRGEGPFQVLSGDLAFVGAVRGGDVELSGGFDLCDRRVSLHSAFGPLEIEAPEPKRTLSPLPVLGGEEEPSAPISNPLARAVSLRAANGVITAFAAVARVATAAVALSPEKDGEDPGRDYRVDLRFGGAETLFFLHGLADRAGVRPSIGRIALGARPSAIPTPAEFGPLYSLPLESANLRLTRWRDLAALSFRFAGLNLTFEAGGFMVRPRGLARQSTPALTNVPPPMSGAVADSRPLLVVDLPPQHVAEEAFFVQRALRPQPPDYPLEALAANDPKAADDARQLIAQLRSLYLRDSDPLDGDAEHTVATQRQTARQRLKGIIDSHFPTTPPDAVKDYTVFAATFAADGRVIRLPAEQQIYIGPEFLDPAARLYAEEVRNATPGTPMFDFLPEDPVSDSEMGGIKQANPKATDQQIEDIARERRKMRDPAFVLFGDAWKSACSIPRPSSLKSAIDLYCNSKLASITAIATFKGQVGRAYGRTQLLQDVESARIKKDASIEDINALNGTMFWVWSDTLEKLGLSGIEEPTAVSRHFLSGPSRLAFRVNTDDARDDRAGAFPLSADSLTNWSRHELVVVRRAQKLFKAYEEGTRRPAWDRDEDSDLADQLLAQGFTRGGFDPDLAGKGDAPRNWPLAFVTAEERLGEVATLATAPPSEFETSIEMPFRLQLSPAQDGRFRTRRVVPGWIFTTFPGDVLKTVADPLPLWTTEFEVEPNSALRAVWSPDFRPEAFRARGMASECLAFDPQAIDRPRVDRPPPHGPFAPWMISRGVGDCTTLPWSAADMRTLKFRTSLDASDRHELVTLSSVHGLPVIGKLKDESGLRTGIDQRRPPNGFQVATGGWAQPSDRLNSLRQNDIYVPPPLDVEGLELGMSSLGGFLRVNAHFEPPASILDGAGQSYFPALSVERWRHRIVLGRDISAEVVYKGYLYPCGHRAALVKITERRFEKVEGRQGPVAVLRQRMFLRIPNRPKKFGAFRQADSGRRLPFTEMLVTTQTTPDIVDPYDNDSDAVAVTPALTPVPTKNCTDPNDDCKIGDVSIYASGRLKYNGAGVAFWPRVAKRAGSEVKFDFLLDGKVSTRLPFIFVDNAAANDQRALAEITRYYNRLSGELSWNSSQARDTELPGLALVAADIKGAQLTYAPEAKSGDTQHETYSLVLAAEGRGADTIPRRPGPDDVGYQPLVAYGNIGSFFSDPFMQGADQPPFYPAMRYATIRAAQIERLTGRPLGPLRVAYDPSYARAGFDAPLKDKLSRFNPRDIYLSVIAKPPPDLDFGSAGDRGGAVARPKSRVLAFSRGLGPVGVSESKVDGAGHVLDDLPQPSNDYDWPPAVALWYDKHKETPAPAGAGGLPIVPVNDGGGAPGVPPELTAFFDPHAKLLGLVELSQVIKAFTGEDLLPVLQEINEFGGDLAGATDQQVRENVLQPLRDALVALLNRIVQIDTDIKNSTPSGKSSLTVEEVYRDVYVTLQSLIASLEAALGSPSASDAAAALAQAKAYSAIYANGKSFLASLDKALRDPATPLTQKLQDYLKTFENQLTSTIADDIRADADLLAGLDVDARKTLGRAVRDRLVKQIFTPLFAILFPPPTPEMMDSASTLKQTLLDALAAPGVWPMLEGDGTATKGFDLTAFGTSLAAHGVAPDAIKIYLGSDALELAIETGNALEAIRGVVTAKGDPAAVIGAFAAFADPLKNSLQIAKVSNELRSACQSGATLVRDYFLLLVDGAATTVDTLRGKVQASQNAMTHNGDAIKGALDKLAAQFGTGSDLQAPITELADAYKAFFQAVSGTNITGWCKTLSDALSTLALNLPAPAALCGGTAGAFTTTVKSLKELQSLRNGVVNELKSLAAPARQLVSVAGRVLPDFFAKMNGSPLFAPDSGDGTWSLPVPVGAADKPFAALAATLAADLLVQATSLLASAANTLSAVTLAKVLVDSQAVRDFRDAYNAFSSVWSNVIPGTDPMSGTLPADFTALKEHFDDALFKKTRDMASALSALAIPTSVTVSDWSLYASQASGHLVDQSDFGKVLDTVVDVVGDTGEPLKRLIAGASGWTETRLILILGHAGPPEALLSDAVAAAAKALPVATVAKALQKLFEEVQNGRVALAQQVFNLQSLPLQALAPLRARVRAALTAPDTFNSNSSSDTVDAWKASWKGDNLDFQTQHLKDIATNLDPAAPGDGFPAIVDFSDLLSGWKVSPSAHDLTVGRGAANAILVIIIQSANALQDILGDILRGQVASLIDFDAVKTEMERRLRQFVPTRQTLTYDLDVPLQNFPTGDNAIFLPGDSRLTLRSRASIDLLNPSGRPDIAANGVVGPFSVKLLGGFMDIVTLSFDGARFGTDTGGRLKANVVGVKLGEAVQFLQQLSSFFAFGENGFYLRVLFDPPGIEAGYAMPPMGFALGVLGISNISLNAGVLIPFTDAPAMFTVGLSSPERPFLINAAVYGGGGHLKLYSSAQGIVGFEASFEAGAVVSFIIGILQGQGRVTFGVFLRSFKAGGNTVSTIEGMVTAAGAASIAMFQIAAMLQVRAGQMADGSMQGTALFTFSFSVGLTSIDFRVTARHQMGQGFAMKGGPIGAIEGDTLLAGDKPLVVALADGSAFQTDAGGGAGGKPTATLISNVVCKGEDYDAYDAYFRPESPFIVDIWNYH